MALVDITQIIIKISKQESHQTNINSTLNNEKKSKLLSSEINQYVKFYSFLQSVQDVLVYEYPKQTRHPNVY